MNDITPKEAIANLNHIYGMVAPDIQRSLDVAIKALERPSGDCISRSILDEIWQLYKDYQPNLATEVIEFGNALEKLIDNAQAVERSKDECVVEWETTVHGLLAYKVCGGCKAEYLFDLTYGWKLCPKCGAKIKGGAE